MLGRGKAAKLNDSNSVLSLRSRQDSMSYAAMRCRVKKPWLSKRWTSSSSSGVVIELGHSRFWASHSRKNNHRYISGASLLELRSFSSQK